MSRVDTQETGVVITSSDVNAGLTMQVATTRENRPWICTVYFVIFNGKFYWLSYPERRHSEELSLESRAAIAVVLQATQPVVGIQAEGDVAIVRDIDEASRVLDLYVAKYDQGAQFIEHLKAGTNKHVLYGFTPHQVLIFDERETRGRELPQAEVRIV
jgi:hypothetical protein